MKVTKNCDGKRFQQAGTTVINKLSELRVCKSTVKEFVQDLASHSDYLVSTLTKLDQNIRKLENRRRFLHTSGVAATTLGTSIAAILWAIAYVNEEQDGYCTPLAWLATGVGIGGTVVKMGTSFVCFRSNRNYIKELESENCVKLLNYLKEAESTLNSRFVEMIQLLKDLYGGDTKLTNHKKKNSEEHSLLHRRSYKLDPDFKEEDSEETSRVITVMETADSASCAPSVISSVLEYSSDFGLESMEALEQTYEAATASLGEIISFGILEGAANGLSVVLSTYEIYRVIGSWNKENPTSQKIKELITNIQKKCKVFSNLIKCIETVDVFLTLKKTQKLR